MTISISRADHAVYRWAWMKMVVTPVGVVDLGGERDDVRQSW